MALMFIAMFWMFEFAKISMQNVRKAKANFASNEGAQSNFKWLYCIVILLLCRAPIEHREYASMSIAQLPPPFLFVHWGCRKILRRREYSRWNMARESLVNNCWEGSLYLLLCFFCFFLCFASNHFPKKELHQIRVQNNRFLFSSSIFTSRVKNTWLCFLKIFLLTKKGRHICQQRSRKWVEFLRSRWVFEK